MFKIGDAISDAGSVLQKPTTMRSVMANPFVVAALIVIIVMAIVLLVYDEGTRLKTALFVYVGTLGIVYASEVAITHIDEEKYGSRIVEQVSNMPSVLQSLPMVPPQFFLPPAQPVARVGAGEPVARPMIRSEMPILAATKGITP
jgi:hypothetical protein